MQAYLPLGKAGSVEGWSRVDALYMTWSLNVTPGRATAQIFTCTSPLHNTQAHTQDVGVTSYMCAHCLPWRIWLPGPRLSLSGPRLSFLLSLFLYPTE